MSIDTVFRLPAPLPTWPAGGGFAKGVLDLGGLEVSQVSTFEKIWSAKEGGQNNLGATFFRPASLPDGFSLLGCYAQPNANPLFGWVLVARDTTTAGAAASLASPVDYTLVWSSDSSSIKQDGRGYFWLPVAPAGYNPVGLLVTSTPEKPQSDAIRCVRADLTEESESDPDSLVWSGKGLDVSALRPRSRGTQAAGVRVGTFGTTSNPNASCLKNVNFSLLSCMPNPQQIGALLATYAPVIRLHPDEPYLPSSVRWFFTNGALLYSNFDTSSPSAVAPDGSNLPQGGSADGAYWLDLPTSSSSADRVKKGDLSTATAYFHVKPILGGVFTDIATWVFYPFNGPAKAKVGPLNIALGKIGEHVGDWEHVTVRVSNLTGELWRLYFSQHSSGQWVDASKVEFQLPGPTNKPVAYSSLHGHAHYPQPGLVLQGNAKDGVGIRNDTAGGGPSLDTVDKGVVVAAEYLQEFVGLEPAWLNYFREWGPKKEYDLGKELDRVAKWLPKKIKDALRKLLSQLPAEVLGEEGPTGPKEKGNWTGDER